MRVVLDLDGLLNDLPQVLLAWINGEYGMQFDLKDVTDYTYISNILGRSVSRFWQTPGYYGSVSPLPCAREFVERLKLMVGDDNVSVCTITPEAVEPEKDAHITEHFSIPKSRIIHATVKHHHTEDAVLIDDYRFHVLDHVRNNSTPAILFDNGGMYGWSKVSDSEMAVIPEGKRRNIILASTYKDILNNIARLLGRV
jgi:hypothetical protein